MLETHKIETKTTTANILINIVDNFQLQFSLAKNVSLARDGEF